MLNRSIRPRIAALARLFSLTALVANSLGAPFPAAADASSIERNRGEIRTTAGHIADFEDEAGFAKWTFDNGREFPGSKGSLVAITAYGSRCAELRYDFAPPADTSVPFNPAYVQASTLVSADQAAGATRLRLKLRLSRPTIKGEIRIEDATGQMLQYNLTGKFPFTATSASDWTTAVVNLALPVAHWGGADNGTICAPIKQVSVLLDAAGARDTGWLRFDDVEFLGATAPVTIRLDDATLFASAKDPGSLGERAGVNIHFTKDERAMDLIKAAGFRWIRMDTEWDGIERIVGRYDFSAFDTLVTAAEKRGLRVLAILDYGHPAYTGNSMAAPRAPAAIRAYGAFCEAMARHYAGRDVTFEIWNEPDVKEFWSGAANADEYAAVLREGIDAVLHGNPQARVLTGGLSSTYDVTYAFWDVLERRGAMAGAGGWGTHLYGCESPETRWTDILLLRERAARVMPGQQVWCTEWGYSSTTINPAADGHDATAREIQAAKFIRQLLVSWWANLPLTVLYDIRDDGEAASEAENNFGLLARDYSDKPAMKAVRSLLSMAKGRSIAGMMIGPAIPDDVHVLRLDGATGKIYIIWAEESSPAVSVQFSERRTRVSDIFGRPLKVRNEATGSTIEVTLSNGPVYLEIANP